MTEWEGTRTVLAQAAGAARVARGALKGLRTVATRRPVGKNFNHATLREQTAILSLLATPISEGPLVPEPLFCSVQAT